MKKLCLYIIAIAFVALMATSCARKQIYNEMDDFTDAEIEDGPPCGCQDISDDYYIKNMRLHYNSRLI